MYKETTKQFAKYRLKKAKETVNTAEFIYKEIKDCTSANNRAYYAIFYAIRSVLALEQIDFKRHKAVIAYFNKNYIHTGIFDKQIGRKISQAQRIREDSDYDDEYEPSPEKTLQQIETTKELIKKVEEYINKKISWLIFIKKDKKIELRLSLTQSFL